MIKYSILKTEALSIPVKIFGAIGIELNIDENSSNVLKHPIVFLYFVISTVVSTACKLCYAVKYFDNIKNFSHNLVFCLAGFIGCTFASLFVFRKNNFDKLIFDFKSMNEKVSSSESIEISSQKRRVSFLARIQFVVTWVTVVYLYLPSLFIAIIGLIKNENINAPPPMLGSYPYDNENPVYFLITCFLNIGLVTLAATTVIGVNSLFSYYLHMLVAHFNILCSRFVTFGKSLELAENSDRRRENIFVQQFEEIFCYHSNLIVLTKRLDKLFAPILFFVVLFSSLELCLFIFQLQVAENISEIMRMVMSFVAVLAQTMLFCFGGQIVKNCSEKLHQEIYLSIPWHILNKPMARSLLFVLKRAQKGNNLTGYFFVADCQLFVVILKSASSFSALFRAIKDAE